MKYAFSLPKQSTPADLAEAEEVSNIAHSFLPVGTLRPGFFCSAPACWEEISGRGLTGDESGPRLFIFQIVISAMPSHSRSSRHTIPLEFWLFPNPTFPSSPGMLPDTSPGSVVASPRRPGWQDWNTSLAEECPHCFTLQKLQSWDYLQNLLGIPVPCSAPLPPWLHGVPNRAEPSCFLTPKMVFPHLVMESPSTQTLSSSSLYYFLPVLLHHCGFLPSSHVGSIYPSGMGWLTRRQFHWTVSGSCLGGFSTLMDKLLRMVLNAC